MLEGGCLCGGVRYAIEGDVIEIHHCHCSLCRRSHGAPCATFAGLRAADLRWTRGEDLVRGYRATDAVERGFCARCGSRLTFRFDALPDRLWISFPTVDDPGPLRPQGHIFVGSKAPWHEIADDLPRHAEYPE